MGGGNGPKERSGFAVDFDNHIQEGRLELPDPPSPISICGGVFGPPPPPTVFLKWQFLCLSKNDVPQHCTAFFRGKFYLTKVNERLMQDSF